MCELGSELDSEELGEDTLLSCLADSLQTIGFEPSCHVSKVHGLVFLGGGAFINCT